jgi:hypothetical protein
LWKWYRELLPAKFSAASCARFSLEPNALRLISRGNAACRFSGQVRILKFLSSESIATSLMAGVAGVALGTLVRGRQFSLRPRDALW